MPESLKNAEKGRAPADEKEDGRGDNAKAEAAAADQTMDV